ncbi:unnamed protein product, partial [Mesorhabditis spiculigera]
MRRPWLFFENEDEDSDGVEPISKRKLENITWGLGRVDLEERQLPDVSDQFADDLMEMDGDPTDESSSDEAVEPIIEEPADSFDGTFDSTQCCTTSSSGLSIHQAFEGLIRSPQPPFPWSPSNGQVQPGALALYRNFPRSEVEISELSDEELVTDDVPQEGRVEEPADDAQFPTDASVSSPQPRATTPMGDDDGDEMEL